MSVLSAVARGREGNALLDFAEANGLAADWAEPRKAGVKVMLTGNSLDNRYGNDKLVKEDINPEYLVHLDGPRGTCVINLATMLALAAAYIKYEGERAAAITDKKTAPP